jgi:hypothetical protein
VTKVWYFYHSDSEMCLETNVACIVEGAMDLGVETVFVLVVYRKDHSFVEVSEASEEFCVTSWICARLMNCQTGNMMVTMKTIELAGWFIWVSTYVCLSVHGRTSVS